MEIDTMQSMAEELSLLSAQTLAKMTDLRDDLDDLPKFSYENEKSLNEIIRMQIDILNRASRLKKTLAPIIL